MLYRALLFVSAAAAGIALVSLSIPAAIAAGVLGVFAFTAKGLAL